MKRIISTIILAAAIAFSSCIQDEPANSEADIIEVHLADESSVLISPPIVGNENITFIVSKTASREMAPEFVLSEGATIKPASGSIQDFSQPVVYTVTSQDRAWKKKYTIRVLSDLQLKYDFETYDDVKSGKKTYNRFFEQIKNMSGEVVEDQFIWGSGNAGAALVAGGTPDQFPTYAAKDQGRNGSTAAKLTTISTGKLGAIFGSPIAAGNLFIGTFDLSNATTKPLEATLFGFPVNKKPVSLKGWYKYTSGTKDYNGNLAFPPDAPDSCRIYAVFYESDESGLTLNGANVLTSERIVAVAKFHAPAQTTEWAKFTNDPGMDEIPFDYDSYPNKFSQDKLMANKYNITIVFSSSYKGDKFIGAINSTLLIDDVEITTAPVN